MASMEACWQVLVVFCRAPYHRDDQCFQMSFVMISLLLGPRRRPWKKQASQEWREMRAVAALLESLEARQAIVLVCRASVIVLVCSVMISLLLCPRRRPSKKQASQEWREDEMVNFQRQLMIVWVQFDGARHRRACPPMTMLLHLTLLVPGWRLRHTKWSHGGAFCAKAST